MEKYFVFKLTMLMMVVEFLWQHLNLNGFQNMIHYFLSLNTNKFGAKCGKNGYRSIVLDVFQTVSWSWFPYLNVLKVFIKTYIIKNSRYTVRLICFRFCREFVFFYIFVWMICLVPFYTLSTLLPNIDSE